MKGSASGTLRALTADDLGMILAWRNHDSVRMFMFEQALVSVDEHAKWFETVHCDPSKRTLIFEDDGCPAGFVSLKQLAREGLWEWGFYAAPGAPAGTGRRLAEAALCRAFKTERAHKVCGRVLAHNAPSLRLHHRLGFSQEGVLRQHHAAQGAWYDVHCFGLLAAEWPAAEALG
ncbi:MAG: UDP-4-amino-4,6-dideoxy-N-acetyl-beta-L-altrosamine N-acetyltransferase [Betaproteobacteria bacterium]|nr:UDP-4-amino-4,6-dideoxy-N-acetyl-beta-L-altrosamine N-acetyltransferase [Betaproteobacteria bacterium]